MALRCSQHCLLSLYLSLKVRAAFKHKTKVWSLTSSSIRNINAKPFNSDIVSAAKVKMSCPPSYYLCLTFSFPSSRWMGTKRAWLPPRWTYGTKAPTQPIASTSLLCRTIDRHFCLWQGSWSSQGQNDKHWPESPSTLLCNELDTHVLKWNWYQRRCCRIASPLKGTVDPKIKNTFICPLTCSDLYQGFFCVSWFGDISLSALYIISFQISDIFNTQHLTRKQITWINTAAANRKNMYSWYWNELSN